MNPVQTLSYDAVLVAHMANAISKALHSGGIAGAWEGLQALLAFKDIDFVALKASLSDLTIDEDRQAIEKSFSDALSLQNAAVQAKILQSVNVLESGVSYVEQGIALYKEVLSLISKAKEVIGG